MILSAIFAVDVWIAGYPRMQVSLFGGGRMAASALLGPVSERLGAERGVDRREPTVRPVLELIKIPRRLYRISELAFEGHQTSEMISGIITGLADGRDIEVTRYRTGTIVHVPAAADPGALPGD
jgi:hypothetical protein